MERIPTAKANYKWIQGKTNCGQMQINAASGRRKKVAVQKRNLLASTLRKKETSAFTSSKMKSLNPVRWLPESVPQPLERRTELERRSGETQRRQEYMG